MPNTQTRIRRLRNDIATERADVRRRLNERQVQEMSDEELEAIIGDHEELKHMTDAQLLAMIDSLYGQRL